ncbi:MAG: acyl-CoA synthetase FdrA [Candidatus Riflebacteria bacterium]|nr:acyl-CoA synthetase FdrA [Candidatus Riflebacteria bacterium]
MTIRHQIRQNTYFDSVTLMLVTNQVKKIEGVELAVVGMGTDYNIDSLKRLGLYKHEFDAITPADLVLCVQTADEASGDAALIAAEKLLTAKKNIKGGTSREAIPVSQEASAKMLAGANFTLISVPGAHAAREATISLNAGRHVMLFSDNVTIEEELALKEKAVAKELLVMGPDCGTAIINGVPLAFANVVRRGEIGLVAASGTGLQEVTSIIHRLGFGVSQAIGVGGRDLSEKIGGRMTLLGAQALANDPQTKALVLISKPPAEKTLEHLYRELKQIYKPIVIYFIGADPDEIRKAGFTPALNLEDAAIKACELAGKKPISPLMTDDQIADKVSGLQLPGKWLRGLYSGGTLCDEAQRLLFDSIPEITSNTPVKGAAKLDDIFKSEKNAIIDLGDDEFTRGKAHPMIDPSLRQERIVAEMADQETGLILLDIVLGYGSHMDMAGEMASAIVSGEKRARRRPAIFATICGTEDDPQVFSLQAKKLEEIGVFVFPSNVSMIKAVKAVFSQ